MSLNDTVAFENQIIAPILIELQWISCELSDYQNHINLSTRCKALFPNLLWRTTKEGFLYVNIHLTKAAVVVYNFSSRKMTGLSHPTPKKLPLFYCDRVKLQPVLMIEISLTYKLSLCTVVHKLGVGELGFIISCISSEKKEKIKGCNMTCLQNYIYVCLSYM